MRTFDPDAFDDAFDTDDRPGMHVLPWEMWERDRPWRADTPRPDAPPEMAAETALE